MARLLSVSRYATLAAALAGCLLPSAQIVPYTPRPERALEPLVVLRRLAQRQCKEGVEVEGGPALLRYTSPCWTDWKSRPAAKTVDLTRVTEIRIRFGDWYQLYFVRGGHEVSIDPLSFATKEDAELAADAVSALLKQPNVEGPR